MGVLLQLFVGIVHVDDLGRPDIDLKATCSVHKYAASVNIPQEVKVYTYVLFIKANATSTSMLKSNIMDCNVHRGSAPKTGHCRGTHSV